MAAELFTPPSRALDANADPYSGALAYFYATGTTTPQAVYTTSGLGTPHANPVVADSAGKFANCYFDASLTYRVVIKNSAGSVTLHDIDPVNAGSLSLLAASGGAALVGFLQAGTGAVARTAQSKMRDIVSIEDFRNGSTYSAAEDLAAFNLAVAAASGARVVILPRTSYNLTGAVIPADTNVRKIVGFETVVTVTATLNAIGIISSKVQFLEIEGIQFASSGTKGDGLNVSAITVPSSASYHIFRKCKFSNFSGDALPVTQCVNFSYYDIDGSSCGRLYNFAPSGGSVPCTAVYIEGGYVSGCNDGVYSANGITNFTIRRTKFEYCGVTSDATRAAINIQGGQGAEADTYFEANEKNLRTIDSLYARFPKYELAGVLANSQSFVGVAFSDRGLASLTNRSLTIGEILPDATVDVSVTTGLHVGGSGASQVINLNAGRVLTVRKTGWTVDTGTAKRTANATYTPGTLLPFGAAYSEAELDAAATRIAAIEDALRDQSQKLKALIDDLHGTAGHGLIGT